MTKIRTEVSIETNETFVLKRKSFFVRTRCDSCGHLVSMTTPAEAAFLVCQDLAVIYSMIDKRQIHFRFTNNETTLICLKSLCLI